MVSDPAVAQMRSNFKNTIPYINRFMGLTSECTEQVEHELKYLSNKTSFGADKKLTFSVVNQGESLEIVPEQIYAAYLKKIKTLFANEDDKTDVVLAVPPFYSSIERQAVLDACKIAKVNVLRLINENTAVALCYGFFRRKEFTEKAKNVAFLDVGHGKTTCTIASFTDKKVQIISHASNRNLGGRNFDYLLLNIIGGEFNDKFGCDPRKAPKARLRMLDVIEKTRKMLSANSESSVNIECLLEDEDLHRNISRDELETLIQPEVEQLRIVLQQALDDSKLKTKDIDCVELIGEATRSPSVIRLAEEIFDNSSKRTLNSSECVARGCSLMAAMILPTYSVSNFEIQESNPFPVEVSWSVSDGKIKSQTLFPTGNNFPSVKSLTFEGRSEPMDVGVSYKTMDGILAGLPQLLCRYRIEPPTPKEAKFSLKLRVQLDQNCIPALDSAELIEEYKEIKKIPIKPMKKKAAPAAKEGEADKEGDKKEDKKEADTKEDDKKEPEYTYEEKEVQKTRSSQIHFKYEHHGYGAKQIDEYTKAEDVMCKQDNLILDVKHARNFLETYVYDMRAHLDSVGTYRPYLKAEITGPYLETLNEIESWIYSDGEAAARAVFEEKLTALQSVGEPVKSRFKFHESYKAKTVDFEESMNGIFSKAVEIPEDSHITREEKEKLVKEVEENMNWLTNIRQVQDPLPLYEEPSFDLNELALRKEKMQELAHKTLNKPEPKKEPEKKEEAPKPEEGAKAEDSKQEDAPKEEAPQAPQESKDADMKE
jgi:molecular chaperone DnaK (HSP70)